ncbi:FxSxx-COOH system tetratricopeptide repeat protein [Frankia sp. AgB32]|uniref:FxSxx-COOH system tetratricopeptide repeat protein n=1 Tax=Frankia sp. AgB32 TaxID=631119 RepID=UPI00200C9B7B|nr:FxSxx-COOH system tetratricopeptide repeat protein [Frankia sp. AgB32]MCK9893017.1 FxSxx-COOH system tetratricopeptide repeat protein [Frankia sp. AgB32]
MALANVAWLIASSGQRVLVVDWDLEAPGLQRYFHPFLHDPELRSMRGIMDMIWDFTATVLSPPVRGEEDWFERATAITPYAESLNWDFPKDGTIDFVCSGRHDPAYSQRVSTFDWSAFYEERDGAEFIDSLGANMRASYDWIFIDSRTGLSDTAGICTVQLPDIVVNCFTLSTQSIEGAAAVARSIRNATQGIRILPVPMRVEDGEHKKLELGRDLSRETFDAFVQDFDGTEREQYWGDVEIPYKPYYAYEEILAVFGDRPRQEGTLLAAYERLVSYLTDHQVDALLEQNEGLRRRVLASFERTRVATPSAAVVSYSGGDRSWADWIAAELHAVGFAVTLEPLAGESMGWLDGGLSKPDADADPVHLTVALLSSAYVRSAQGQDRWHRAAARDPDGLARRLLPVRIEDFEPPVEFNEYEHVDLVGLHETPARRALLTAAGRPRRRTTAGRTTADRTTADRTTADRTTADVAGALRFPGAPPQVWAGVPARNPAFVGRESVLAHVRDRFVGREGPPSSTQVLQGLAGVGKTQLAVEYVYRFRSSYDLVCWVGSEQPALVRSGLAALAPVLGLDSRSGHEPIDEVLNALRLGDPYRRWLLVLDNADSPDDIIPLIPHGPGHVLITSRNRRWHGRQDRVEVNPFSRAESIALLRRRAPALTAEVAAQLAVALGDLPLALELAGAWHAETGMSAERYLQLLESDPGPLLWEGEITTNASPIARTWMLSVDRLREKAPTAARLAELCAFFGPEPISLTILYGDGLKDLPEPGDQVFRDEITLGTAVRHVTEHALARVDEKDQSLEMHRLVQAVIRDDLAPPRRADVSRRVQAILAAADPGTPDDPASWPRYSLLRPHIGPAGAALSDSPEVSGLVANVVRSLYTQRDHSGCRELAQETLEIWRSILGEDDQRTLKLALDLADSLRALGHPEQARDLDQTARRRLLRTLGPEATLTLRAAMALGGDLRGMHSYQEARWLDEETYERFRANGWLDRPDGIQIANNLAVSLRFVGDLKHALELSRDVFDRERRLHGEDVVSALQFADSYARDLREFGRYRESLSILETTVERCRDFLGDSHADTLRSLRNRAITLRWCGQTERARSESASTLDMLRDRVGDDHPETLATAVSLVCDLCLAQDYSAARRLAEDTHSQADRRLGANSLYTLAAANALIIALRHDGGNTAAIRLAEQTVETLATSLPEDHPFIFYCTANLANCHYDAANFIRARELDQRVEANMRTKLGGGHPLTMLVAANHAASLARTGQESTGNAVRESVLQDLEDCLGSNHPSTTRVRKGVRIDLEIDPPPP